MKNLFSLLFVLFLAFLFVSCKEYNLAPTGELKSDSPSASSSTLSGPPAVIKVFVKISVGDIVYENLDAKLTVRGFSENDMQQWTMDYDFIGPIDELQVQSGYHHYSVALCDKWGVSDQKTNISGTAVWGGGPPVMIELGGTKAAKKLTMYIISHEVDSPGGLVAELEAKAIYHYTPEGRVESILHQYFNTQAVKFEDGETETFCYNGDQVSEIQVTSNGRTIRKYKYTYGTNNTITETNVDSGDVTVQTVKNNSGGTSGNQMTLDYQFSNGNALLYQFGYTFKNIVEDKTEKSGELCNTGNYTYDKNINPFRQLGYDDFNLQNWSANNKLTEDVDFISCSYPTLIPLYHLYAYDLDGYPTRKITTYKSGANQNNAHHRKVNFFYE